MTPTAAKLAAPSALALALALTPTVTAAKDGAPAPQIECYTVEQTRQKIAQHRLVPPFLAMQAARGVHQGDALSTRLCHNGEAFIYEIGVLGHDGHVVHVPVDAATGKPHLARPEH